MLARAYEACSVLQLSNESAPTPAVKCCRGKPRWGNCKQLDRLSSYSLHINKAVAHRKNPNNEEVFWLGGWLQLRRWIPPVHPHRFGKCHPIVLESAPWSWRIAAPGGNALHNILPSYICISLSLSKYYILVYVCRKFDHDITVSCMENNRDALPKHLLINRFSIIYLLKL